MNSSDLGPFKDFETMFAAYGYSKRHSLSERTASQPSNPTLAQQISAAAEKARAPQRADPTWEERRAQLIKSCTRNDSDE